MIKILTIGTHDDIHDMMTSMSMFPQQLRMKLHHGAGDKLPGPVLSSLRAVPTLSTVPDIKGRGAECV